MTIRYTRADLGIGKESAPFNLAMATNFRINDLIMEATTCYVELDIQKYKRVLDGLFLEAVSVNTKVLDEKKNQELNEKLSLIKIDIDKEYFAYLKKKRILGMFNGEDLFILRLFNFQRTLMEVLDHKGLITAKQDQGDSALDEMWES